MSYDYNKKLISNSRILRKNMTPEEKHIWYDFLKKLPYTVNRQKNIGNYIVDFYISSKKTVIEIDGIQHNCDENKIYDEKRDNYLKHLNIKVLRYTNHDINSNFTSVCNDILNQLNINIDDLNI